MKDAPLPETPRNTSDPGIAGAPVGGESRTRILRFDAAGVADAVRVESAPGSVLVEARWTEAGGGEPGAGSRVVRWELLEAGSPGRVDRHPAAGGARRVELGSAVILPALVNAHAHLDLTHIGPRAFESEGGFVGWVEVVRRERASEAGVIAGSVREGVRLLRLGGVGAVGDIAGCPARGPTDAGSRALHASGMAGVSYLEFFGLGRARQRGLEIAMGCLERAGEYVGGDRARFAVGLQPHASNTVGLEVYRRALGVRGVAVSTHLAETPEEHEFIGAGRGPQRELLERIGVWEDGILEEIGLGLTPVAHVARVLGEEAVRRRGGPVSLVHVNDCSDGDLDVLAGLRASGADICVVYCPRASAYFGAAGHFGPHRYREMLARGVPVALGTDSIINLPPGVLEEGISTLDEMRLIHQSDGMASRAALEMATVHGARALGMDPGLFSLSRPGPIAGLIAIPVHVTVRDSEVVERVLEGAGRPGFLPEAGGPGWFDS